MKATVLEAMIRTSGIGNCSKTGAGRFGPIRGRAGPVLIDAEVVRQLDALTPLAPLHQPHHLSAIAAIRAMLNSSGEKAVRAKRPCAFSRPISTVTGPAKAR